MTRLVRTPREARLLDLARLVVATGGTRDWSTWFACIALREEHRARVGRGLGEELQAERVALATLHQLDAREHVLLWAPRLPLAGDDAGA